MTRSHSAFRKPRVNDAVGGFRTSFGVSSSGDHNMEKANVKVADVRSWAAENGVTLEEIAGDRILVGVLNDPHRVLTSHESADFRALKAKWEAEMNDAVKGASQVEKTITEEPAASLPSDQADAAQPKEASPVPPSPTKASGWAEKRDDAERPRKAKKRPGGGPKSPAGGDAHEEPFEADEVARQIRDLVSESQRNNLRVGQLFAKAKAKLGRGKFGKFVATETRMSPSFVGKAMGVARLLDGREIVDSTNLPWEALTLLASAKKLSESAREELLDLLLGASRPSLKEFKELLAKAKSATGQNTVVQTIAPESEEASRRLDELLAQWLLDDQLREVAKVLGPAAAARRFKAQLLALGKSSSDAIQSL
ncbi:hypothetical protein WDZ92_36825 [Nostoc sp. NIES-2111]